MNRRSFFASIIGATLAAKLLPQAQYDGLTWPKEWQWHKSKPPTLTAPASQWLRITINGDMTSDGYLGATTTLEKENE